MAKSSLKIKTLKKQDIAIHTDYDDTTFQNVEISGILMEKTKMLPGRIMVTLVCTGTVLGAVGIYEPLMEYAGAGASVPLLGFGNLLWKGMKEAVDQNGFIGLFMGGFTSCAVGVSGALVLGYLASLIFQPKMRK